MKKMLTLLAVAAFPAMWGGCAACCPTGLCPCCPCNWFNRAAPCPPAPVYPAPVAASPCAPTYAAAGVPQYFTPTAAPFTAAPTYVQPQAAAACCPQQPMYYQQAQPAYYSEPGCGYVESSCGAYGGIVGYGPEMPLDYGQCSSGCCDGGVVSPPAPEAYVEPRPAGE